MHPSNYKQNVEENMDNAENALQKKGFRFVHKFDVAEPWEDDPAYAIVMSRKRGSLHRQAEIHPDGTVNGVSLGEYLKTL